MGYKILGNSDNGECERCGKEGLRRTVCVIAVDRDGTPIANEEHWGVCCAAYALHGSKSARNQNKIIRELERLAQERKNEERSRQIDEQVKMARIAVDGDQNNANRFYHRSGRNVLGSYFAQNADGAVVRIDGKDEKDEMFFTARGFVQISLAVAA